MQFLIKNHAASDVSQFLAETHKSRPISPSFSFSLTHFLCRLTIQLQITIAKKTIFIWQQIHLSAENANDLPLSILHFYRATLCVTRSL